MGANPIWVYSTLFKYKVIDIKLLVDPSSSKRSVSIKIGLKNFFTKKQISV